MKKSKKDAGSPDIPVASPPKSTATTMEGRENELIALAYDAAEERIQKWHRFFSRDCTSFLTFGF